jgi:hypothetical protein
MNRKRWRALQDSNLWPSAPEARERRAKSILLIICRHRHASLRRLLLHTVKLRGR